MLAAILKAFTRLSKEQYSQSVDLDISSAAAMDQVRPPLEPSCAICGAPPYPECPHEGESLQRALQQAQDRWMGVQRIR